MTQPLGPFGMWTLMRIWLGVAQRLVSTGAEGSESGVGVAAGFGVGVGSGVGAGAGAAGAGAAGSVVVVVGDGAAGAGVGAAPLTGRRTRRGRAWLVTGVGEEGCSESHATKEAATKGMAQKADRVFSFMFARTAYVGETFRRFFVAGKASSINSF
jgi:hypothetical protein